MPSPLTIRTGYSYQKPPLGAPLNLAHPLAPAVEVAWLFNEGAGIPSEFKHLLTNTVTNPSGAGWVSSPYGPAYQFGSTTFLELPTAYDPLWCQKQVSVFAIVYPVANGSNDRAIIGAFGNNNAASLQVNSSHKVRIERSFGPTYLTSSGNIADGAWSSIFATWDVVAGNYQLAVNGSVDSIVTGGTTDTFSVGGIEGLGAWAGFGTASYWGGGGSGAMALVIIFNRALTMREGIYLHSRPFDMWTT